MISCLSPPITVVFLFGALWRRGTHQAAQATLILGFGLGFATFCLDFFSCPKLLTDVAGVPFLMQAWWGPPFAFPFVRTRMTTCYYAYRVEAGLYSLPG